MANWRRWGPILFGVAVFLVFVALGAAIFGISWMREHVVIESATVASAEASFDDVRRKFAGRTPLIEVKGGAVRRQDPAPDAPPATLTTLHILAWDPEDGRIARVDLPFWLLRLKETPIQFGEYASGLGDMNVTLRAAEIERYGPGIIIDAEIELGGRALVWVE